jgi:hypothetical protein
MLFPLHLMFHMPATNVVFILAARLTEQILQYIGLYLQLTENCNYFTNIFHKVTVNTKYNQRQTCFPHCGLQTQRWRVRCLLHLLNETILDSLYLDHRITCFLSVMRSWQITIQNVYPHSTYKTCCYRKAISI